MFLLHVIIFMYVFCQLSYSRTLTLNNRLDLGNGVRFTWALQMKEPGKLTLKIDVELPQRFRWITVGFHDIPYTHRIWEDMAMISIDRDMGQEVSFLKTLHIDQAEKVSESRWELYDWAENGRKKSAGVYYFTMIRKLKYLKSCEPVSLVWAYGQDIVKDKYPNFLVQRFQYKILTLDPSGTFVCTPSKYENGMGSKDGLQGANQYKTEEKSSGYEGKNTDDDNTESDEPPDMNEPTRQMNKKTNDFRNQPTEMNEPTRQMNKKTNDFRNQPTEMNEPTQAMNEKRNDYRDQTTTNTPKQRETTKLFASSSKPTSPIPTTAPRKPVEDVTTEKVMFPTTENYVPTKPVADVTEKVAVPTIETHASTKDVADKKELVVPSSKPYVPIKDTSSEKLVKMPSKATAKPTLTGKQSKENLVRCQIDPCMYSQCPNGTRCIPNLVHCTSACTPGDNDTSVNTKCACRRGSHWYDFFKDNENSVYFVVIGVSALFTGFIVLCLACCCANKSRKLKPRNIRKNKVSFYKVDDFESSADEEVEFLQDEGDDDMKSFVKGPLVKTPIKSAFGVFNHYALPSK